MATDIDQAFVKQFEAEVKEAYQRQGSKLRNTVRTKNNVRGKSTTMQTVGKGTATTKSRHGQVPPMSLDHTPVQIDLADYYAGDWVDRLDTLKIEHDERQVVSNAGAYALGRKTDELIITALGNTSQTVGANANPLNKSKVLEGFRTLGQNDVPDDGLRYFLVGWQQWEDLLGIPEFANADYVGSENLPWQGTQAKRWLGMLVMPHSGLPVSSNIRDCFMYHRSAVGHASGADVTTDITWHGDHAAWFVNNMMSQGAALIDGEGVVKVQADES